MNIQIYYSLIFSLLACGCLLCSIRALNSDKPIKKATAFVNFALITPLIANILLANTHTEWIAAILYPFFYISMTAVLIAVVYFTNEYCQGADPNTNKKSNKPTVMYILGSLDIIQILLGFITHHVLKLESIVVDDQIFYQDIPLIGLTIHRVICYGLFLGIILIFTLSTIKSSRLYREKYLILLCMLLISGCMQMAFIITRSPIDRSVAVHALVGILIYYFSIEYRPLRLLDALLSNITSNMNDAVFVFDGSYKCVWMNAEGCKLLQLNPTDTAKVKNAIIEMFGDLTGQGDEWTRDLYVPKNKGYYIVEKKSVKSNQLLDGCFLIIKDSTERHNAAEREIYESTHDKLTGLWNQAHLYDLIQGLLRGSVSSEEYLIMYLNVKNFKIINDIFGTSFGDLVLIKIADWLNANIKNSEGIYGRLIGDTFGIFMPVETFNEDKFLQGLSNFTVTQDNKSHQICIHMGVYLIKDKTLDVSVMFDRAHMATQAIGEDYKTCLRYYDEALRSAILEEQNLINHLPDALATNQIRPYLQPITDIHGKVVGAEALARWVHPELGFLSPAKFIPVFERHGLIADLDQHIWETACQILNSWKGKYDDLFISINISPKDFYFIDVVQTIRGLVKKYDIRPDKLRIEITETALMADPEEKIKIFNALRAAGFIVEMDDFGSGYSSLNLLKDMPVDVLKIDMNFLNVKDNAQQADSKKAELIIYNIIAMSKDLEITSLTEGVETLYQFEQLARMGCTLFQGYYFSKPMSVEDFEKFLITNRGDHT